MSEKLSLIPQFNLGSSRTMDVTKLKPQSITHLTSPETGDKFSKFLEKEPKKQAQTTENTEKSLQYQKQSSQQSDKAHRKNTENKTDKDHLETVTKDVKNILNDTDLSLEEKIDELAELPEFTELSFIEKVNMLANILENMPDLKENFAAFLIENNDIPLETTALDEDITLEDAELSHDLSDLTKPDTEEDTLHALEEDASTKEIVAVIQHIFKNDDKPTLAEHSPEATSLSEQAKISLPTDNPDINEGKEDALLGEMELDSQENLEDVIITEEQLVKTEQNTAPQTAKDAMASLLDKGEAKADMPSLSDLNTNNNLAQQQLNNAQNTIQRNHAELKIATIPLKDNISMVVTKSPENPNKIGINLEPAGMGEAELVIETKDNVVTAVVRAEKTDILDMIRKETASLERHLKEAGIDLGGGNLQFEQQNSNDNAGENSEKTRISAAFEDNPITNNAPTAPETIYQTLSSLDISKGIDVRL